VEVLLVHGLDEPGSHLPVQVGQVHELDVVVAHVDDVGREVGLDRLMSAHIRDVMPRCSMTASWPCQLAMAVAVFETRLPTT